MYIKNIMYAVCGPITSLFCPFSSPIEGAVGMADLVAFFSWAWRQPGAAHPIIGIWIFN